MAGEPVAIPLGGKAGLCITASSGRVEVVAEERADVFVPEGDHLGEVSIDLAGNVALLSADAGSASLQVLVPKGTHIRVGTASGRVEMRGDFGDVRVTTGSGKIAIERASSADIRSVSGSITVKVCGGQCRLQTKSGKAEVGSSEQTEISTESGKVSVDCATGGVQVRTASGKVEVGAAGSNDVAVQTLSGSVRVKVPRGTRPAARLESGSGKPRCDCEQGSDCRVAVSSMSGKIEVVPG